MKVIAVRNVEEALHRGLEYIYQEGIKEESRAGPVLVSPCPVTTVYSRPQERVLFSAARDANPFFHLFEALFYIAGRNDIKWLDQFVGDFSKRFAEPDGTLHGSYGYRWRKHFDMEGGGSEFLPDQLDTIIELLKKNPQDRQAVLTMWDPPSDLGVQGLRDRPCNTHCYFRVRKDVRMIGVMSNSQPEGIFPVLDITVCCRSNDLVWGAYGANAVQFSILLEYMAARIGVGVGKYYQISHNFHAYQNVLDDLEGKGILEMEEEPGRYERGIVDVTPIVTVPKEFDADLLRFMYDPDACSKAPYQNDFFHTIAVPMYQANMYWKAKDRQKALQYLAQMPPTSDWRLACYQWCQRRIANS